MTVSRSLVALLLFYSVGLGFRCPSLFREHIFKHIGLFILFFPFFTAFWTCRRRIGGLGWRFSAFSAEVYDLTLSFFFPFAPKITRRFPEQGAERTALFLVSPMFHPFVSVPFRGSTHWYSLRRGGPPVFAPLLWFFFGARFSRDAHSTCLLLCRSLPQLAENPLSPAEQIPHDVVVAPPSFGYL